MVKTPKSFWAAQRMFKDTISDAHRKGMPPTNGCLEKSKINKFSLTEI